MAFWEAFKIPIPVVNNSERLLFLTALVGAIILLIKRRIRLTASMIVLELLVIWSLMASWRAIEADLAFEKIMEIMGGMAVFIFFAALPIKQVKLDWWTNLWIILGLLCMFLSLLFWRGGEVGSIVVEKVFGGESMGWFLMEYSRGRIVPFGAIYMTFLLPIIWMVKERRTRIAVICLFLGVMAVALSNYRSMVLAMIGGVIIAAIGLRTKIEFEAKKLIAMVIIVVLIAVIMTGSRFLMRDKSDVASLMARKGYLVEAMEIIKENPVWGVGAGNFKFYVKPMIILAKDGQSVDTMPGQTHNQLVTWTAEMGLPGGVLFLTLLLIFLKSDWKQWNKKSFESKELVLAAVGWVYIIGSMLDEYPMYGFYTFLIIRGILENRYENCHSA